MAKLSDIKIRNWIKNNERFDLRSDGDGLNIRYRENDKYPSWRFRCIGHVMQIGRYPDVSLAQALDEAKTLRAKITLGINPVIEKRKLREKLISDTLDARLVYTVDQLVVATLRWILPIMGTIENFTIHDF